MGNRDRIPTGPIGFRLAHELEGLLQGISADGVITEEETVRLRRWLDDNASFALIHPFQEIDTHLTRVLSDGVVTTDECEDLLFVVRKYTTVNPHFDQLRGGLQVLMGFLAGAAADRHLDEVEVRALSDWTEEWSHLRGLWPYDEVSAIVAEMLSRNRVTEDAAYLFDLARQFPVAGASEDVREAPSPLLLRGVCAVDPIVEFEGRTFVFTGESHRCGRGALEALVAERAGRPWPRVRNDVDYLVVCDAGSPFWAFSCYGRKVEQAYKLRREGHPILIVHEADFWDAIANAAGAGV